MRRSEGFSLIEIAVVLAIIAIIAAAAIMSGGSVFGRSGMTSLLSGVKDLGTASREFKTRYSYFPGDLPNAGTYITGSGGVSAGCTYAAGGTTGNGIVDTATESGCALEHLVKAGMLKGIDYDAAASLYFIAINNWGTGTRLSLWFDSTANMNAVRATNLPCEIALEVDRRLDSATTGTTPFTDGSVRARNSADAAIQTCVPGSTNDPVATLLVRY